MFEIDWLILIAVLLLTAIGLTLIYSTTYQSTDAYLFNKQLLLSFVALGAMVAGFLIPLKLEYIFAYLFYAMATTLLLLLLLLPGQVNRWIDLGPFQFQPSEIAKLAFVFALSRFLFDNRKNINSLRVVLLGLLITIVPFYLIIKEPDLGTALTLLALYVGLLWVARLQPIYIFLIISPMLSLISAFNWIVWALYFIILIVILYITKPSFKLLVSGIIVNLFIGIITPLLWNNLNQYQKDRILIFLDPSRDPFGAGYQIIQSKITIGSGGILGKGFLSGTQTNLAFLPARSTDFIFATLGEQFGFIGSIVVLVLYFILLTRIIKIIKVSRNLFAKYVTAGVGFILLLQATINIGMAVGMLPVTGIPLPFISYGGTLLVISYFMIGIVLQAYKQRTEY